MILAFHQTWYLISGQIKREIILTVRHLITVAKTSRRELKRSKLQIQVSGRAGVSSSGQGPGAATMSRVKLLQFGGSVQGSIPAGSIVIRNKL